MQSMTGFARTAGQDARFSWAWEVRSVNSRSLDLRIRMPPGYERLEQAIRRHAAERFHRGNIAITLTVDRAGEPPTYRLNQALLDQVFALRESLVDRIDTAPPRLAELLAVRGMLEAVDLVDDDETVAVREAAMTRSGVDALDALAAARAEEGARLAEILDAHVDRIATLTEAAAAAEAARPEAIRQRLRQLVAELLAAEPALPEERLAQEAALLVGRTDVREELDRLRAHAAAARDLIREGAAVGRRLDFLCQEFNREANTLCAKSSDVELTRLGLALKAAVEQLREQVQNVE